MTEYKDDIRTPPALAQSPENVEAKTILLHVLKPMAKQELTEANLEEAQENSFHSSGFDMNISGKRYGRLVAVRRLKKADNGASFWQCRCDCGCVAVVPDNLLTAGTLLSCGCSNGNEAKCPACGEIFEAGLASPQTPQFCKDCAPKYAGRNWRVCPVCKKLFPEPPSSKTVTCSAECSSQWKSFVHTGIHNKWSAEARKKLSDAGQTENLKLGTAAAQASPIAGRFETNQEAKIWTLVDSEGNEIVVRNLMLWCRGHTELFHKPPSDKSATQISSGFRAIAQTLAGNRGAPGKRSGASTYFGWSLKKLPEEPPT